MSAAQGWTCPAPRYSAACRCIGSGTLSRIVTNSSAAVGWSADGAVELPLGGAALHRDGQALDDLRRIRAEHMGAHDAVALAVHHQLHHRALVPAG